MSGQVRPPWYFSSTDVAELTADWYRFAQNHLGWGAFPEGNTDYKQIFLLLHEFVRLEKTFNEWVTTLSLSADQKSETLSTFLEPSLDNLRVTYNDKVARLSKRIDLALPHA
jgi:hypothetical protein